MSWSLHVEPRPAPAIFRAVDAAEPSSPVSEDGEQQVRAAKAAAKDIIESQAVGGTDKHFNVSLSGHSNPGHEPAKGMANDFITVSIGQVTPVED